ncbi:MAG TPA: hypothetical protein VFW00_10450 [Rhodocyclaceae bacterium]|nr:hypothetical protein [Rhodocyclaceae bacterium]
MLGAPGKFDSEQEKLPVRVTNGAKTPDFPKVVSCVPLMVHVPPGWAHFVQPLGASAAAKAVLAKPNASKPTKGDLIRITFVSYLLI